MSHFWERWPAKATTSSDHSARQRRWADYYRAVEGRPPRDTLVAALEYFAAEQPQDGLNASKKNKRTVGFAVDLGCGDGRDTVELLRCRWRVLAIDGNPEAISRLLQRPNLNRLWLDTRVQPFENMTLPPEVDLINASFCLPFCPPDYFSPLWEEITVSLRTGGRFCGQLFGDRDSWAASSDITTHTRAQLDNLLHLFDVEQLNEEEHAGKTALGEEKYWHLYHLVLRKR